MEQIYLYQAQLDKQLAVFPPLKQFELQTGIPKTYLFLGVIAVVFLLIFFNIGGSLLTNIIGFGFPAYASLRAIESSSKADDTQWLMYWCVFGFLNVVEAFSEVILKWFPFYYFFKVALLVYLQVPQFNGAQVAYERFLRPIISQAPAPKVATN